MPTSRVQRELSCSALAIKEGMQYENAWSVHLGLAVEEASMHGTSSLKKDNLEWMKPDRNACTIHLT